MLLTPDVLIVLRAASKNCQSLFALKILCEVPFITLRIKFSSFMHLFSLCAKIWSIFYNENQPVLESGCEQLVDHLSDSLLCLA